ncbi:MULTISPECIES: vitamin K epoxide reductase family protein [unclassified Nocardioides]|uniref:vitamin K epoxide reductase family protein n=1 Tax=unclassified Nocardioides TaxID=2615069 RepID=UPI00240508CC|nr:MULTISPECIES: vitamin K epoxide reductase family protein [unclassified Nocardioides]
MTALDVDLTPAERAELEALEARDRDRRLGWLLVVTGAVGFVAAVTLLLERIQLLVDPSYVPSCSLNPVLSCGSVMVTEQARVFGFPNPVIGVAAFPVVVAVGAGILAGASYARWFWAGLQAGVVLGAAFVAWLIAQSLYSINALCPYCMVVWAVVVPLAWHVTVRNAEAGVLGAGLARSGAVRAARRWSLLGVVAVYLVVVVLILERFWDYWSTLL